ncbi:MAG: hypothetical protein EP297_15535 [Gammaproteobacteria bacterium]|nr:MAG: hypothetical protein EP297_15535 [Gammaproteobacteria bacterium]
MNKQPLHIVATTISGSIRDWGKLDKIVPLFREHGMEKVVLYRADSHAAARTYTHDAIQQGARTIISAGGSGTFNSVLEGCCDSGVPLDEIKLGFLRKGSADLIGKALGMPDQIDQAIEVFVNAIRNDNTIPCDVILARSNGDGDPPRHFVGYGGAEIFGRIPHYTENRLIKYYKGILSQFFGDLGPFTVGMSLASIEKVFKVLFREGDHWTIRVDGKPVSSGRYQALLILNGYLGPDLPFSSDPLGSGRIHLFAIKDLGRSKIIAQAKSALDKTILKDPDRFGLEHYCAYKTLEMAPSKDARFPVNVDGSTMHCRHAVQFSIDDSIHLFNAQSQ